ncbi:Bacterial type II secretion system protein F domain protein [Rubripirellula amarantea]|uniref:Bacterial type II secretion system protein F domain protein n=1 Tax=Rubripirellula amarantea TaxID=2527999 RepID=A0A5C5WK88_9BACT|nr:type II secretion system F family protein [Rubripirellula amarantea]TWT51196.1 Bacterial type II secretion system protein F domain protein [Rubripirellula amarantea]
MVRLNDQQFANLLDELAYAAAHDLPLPETLDRLRDQRLGKVAKAAEAISERLKQGVALDDAIAIVDSPMTGSVQTALSVCRRTRDATHSVSHALDHRLLSRLSDHLRRRSHLSQLTRLAWAYPVILLLAAYAVLVGVIAPLVRNSLDANEIWAPWLNRMADFFHHNAWWPPIILVVVVFALAKLLRRRVFVSQPSRTSLFCASLADQLEVGVPESEAIIAAAKLSNQQEIIKGDAPKLSDAPTATLIRQATGIGTDIGPVEHTEGIVTGLRILSLQYDDKSHARQRWSTTIIPQIVTLVLGAGFILAYAYSVLRPIYLEVEQW